MNPFVGLLISAVFGWIIRRTSKSDSPDVKQPQPSKYTEDNANTIGQPVPVVLGRALIKNPFVSFYGDFSSEPYTEEYGMHSKLNVWSMILLLLLNILMSILAPDTVVTSGGSGYTVDAGAKRGSILNAIINFLIWLLMSLFNNHAGRTTIQKGFLYYLGWQHIICWTGKNIGIKKLWMNVYDSELEESTETGVWDNDGHIAWEKDNIDGITVNIDDKEMFGGYDEGGGFTGQIRVYFGNLHQSVDPWMVKSMSVDTIDPELRGLTPQYPMYLTCVISNSDKTGGAYIGKQATIPEMWFEVANYPSRLADSHKDRIVYYFSSALQFEFQKGMNFMSTQSEDVQNYMASALQVVSNSLDRFVEAADRYVSNPSVYPIPSQSMLDDMFDKIVIAYRMYPASGASSFYQNFIAFADLCENGIWHLGQLDDDLNPAEAIYEILMNKYWGCNYYDGRIDVDSLIKLGCTCESEKLGVSCLINKTSQANDFVTKILNHINGVKYDDPKTGKLTFKLIRNDYDINKIKTFTTSNVESCEFTRLDWSETTSATEVSFTDASNKYDTGQFTYNDISNRLITGSYTSKSVEGDYFTTTANAKWLAQLTQLANGYPLSMLNLVTNRYAYDLTIGDPIKVSWEPYGLSQVIYRVTDLDYSNLVDGKISITAIEDVFGFDKLDFSASETPQWTDPQEIPTEVYKHKFMEEPYELCRDLNTYIYAYAAQPTTAEVYWDIWRLSGGIYVKSSQSMKWSMVGRLTYGYLPFYHVDVDGIEFSITGANGKELIDDKINKITNYPTVYTSTSGLNLLIIDDEIMSYSEIVRLTNGHYKLKGVIRGIFDTLPAEHTAESMMYFIENRQNILSSNEFIISGATTVESLEITTETRTAEQPFSLLLVESVETTRRSEQPSIMANLKYGLVQGEVTRFEYEYPTGYAFSGDIIFKFYGRNKFNNYGIINQLDDTTLVVVAEDTKNVIRLNCNGFSREWMESAYDNINLINIDTMKLTWEQFCGFMMERVANVNSVVLEICTFNDTKQLYSYQKYVKNIEWRVPRFIGVVADESEALSLAQSYASYAVQAILVPGTSVNPPISLTTNECPLFIEGTITSSNGIKCQDGNNYTLSTTAYRIDGWDENENVVITKIELGEYYTIRSDFTQLVDNYPIYYQYNGFVWNPYTIYTT